MSKISKTAQASMGGPIQIKADPFDTNEKKIHELRNQRANKLAVVRYDFIDALLEEYDTSITEAKRWRESADDFAAQFASVTEQLRLEKENSNEQITKLQDQLHDIRKSLSEALNSGDGAYRP